jgi:hypothetical protein
MQQTRLRLRNGHTYDVREDYKTVTLRIRELDWFEFHAARDGARIMVRSADISAVEILDIPVSQN